MRSRHKLIEARPRSAREISQVSDTTRVIGNQARFVVGIGSAISRKYRATLEMTAVCRP
jgi:hypothetical protein